MYKYIQYLSLDIAIGSVVGAKFIAENQNLKVPASVYSLLFIATFTIYNVDHLLDLRSQKNEYLQERRRFQKRYANYIIALIGLAVLAGSVLLFFCPTVILIYGLILAGGVLIYLIQPNFIWKKEIGSAILYTLGINLPTLSLKTNFSPNYLHFCLLYFGLVLFNILLFAYFERDEDKVQQHSSWAIDHSVKQINLVLGVLLGIIYLELGLAKIYIVEGAWYIFLAMTLILSLPFIFFKTFKIRERYRIIGDAVFLIPLIDLVWIK